MTGFQKLVFDAQRFNLDEGTVLRNRTVAQSRNSFDENEIFEMLEEVWEAQLNLSVCLFVCLSSIARARSGL